jgi:diamine N-acetyltransferase
MPVTAITLQTLSHDNARAVVRLRVAPDQAGFVASNADSIADAYVERAMRPLAVYADDDLVGFTMYGQDLATEDWWIVRMMIDERFQRQGYGRSAMLALIALMRERHETSAILLGVDPANHGAIRLYESLGFRDTGKVHYDEAVMRLEL